MLIEQQFPTDIVEAANKAFPLITNFDEADAINWHTINTISREAYMRGMLNERLSKQTKLAEEAFMAGIAVMEGGTSFITFDDWLKQYQNAGTIGEPNTTGK